MKCINLFSVHFKNDFFDNNANYSVVVQTTTVVVVKFEFSSLGKGSIITVTNGFEYDLFNKITTINNNNTEIKIQQNRKQKHNNLVNTYRKRKKINQKFSHHSSFSFYEIIVISEHGQLHCMKNEKSTTNI